MRVRINDLQSLIEEQTRAQVEREAAIIMRNGWHSDPVQCCLIVIIKLLSAARYPKEKECLVDLYSEIKPEGDLHYILPLNPPEAIRKWGEDNKREGIRRLLLDYKQLFLKVKDDQITWLLTEEQIAAVQSAVEGAQVVFGMNEHDVYGSMNAQEWALLGRLCEGASQFTIDERSSIYFDKEKLTAFATSMSGIPRLDLGEMRFHFSSGGEEEFLILRQLIHKRDFVRFHRAFECTRKLHPLIVEDNRQLATKFKLALSCNPIQELVLQDIAVMQYTPDFFDDLVLSAEVIDLSFNQLATRNEETWFKMLTAASTAKRLILTGNGFNTCSDERWEIFCRILTEVLSQAHTIVFINDLPPERQGNLSRQGKLSTVQGLKKQLIHFLWKHPQPLHAHKLADDVPKDLWDVLPKP